MSRRLAPLLGVAALAALVAAGTATRPGEASPTGSTGAGRDRPVTSTRLVCPGVDGSAAVPVQITVADLSTAMDPQAKASAPITLTTLTRQGAAPRAPMTLTPAPAATTTVADHLSATVVTATGAAAGHLVASQHSLVSSGGLRGLLSAPCLPAVTDTWITGADGRLGHTDVLALANPGSVDAAVTVSAWSETGPVDLPGLQSYSLPAGHVAELAFSDYAPDAGLVSLHVHADVGRVAAQIRDSESVGLSTVGNDWLSPTAPPGRRLVVAGYVAGAGPRLLVLTNPGRDDATVQLRLLTRSRAFVPAGHPDVVVAPGRSALVDLSASLGGVAAAVELTSDHPVLAAGMSRLTSAGGLPDLAWHPASPALRGPAALPESSPVLGAGGVLSLTAVGQPATVRLVPGSGQSRTVQVGADRTITIDLATLFGAAAAGPLAVVPESGAVWATRSIAASGAHGPLLTSLAASPLPPPLRLPLTDEDLRVAVR